jgi:sugar (pentulose or hexulose) kinase
VSLYLGLDSSTQSLTAIVLDSDRAGTRVVYEHSFAFDEALPEYGTRSPARRSSTEAST